MEVAYIATDERDVVLPVGWFWLSSSCVKHKLVLLCSD